jgi:hypothetical protein
MVKSIANPFFKVIAMYMYVNNYILTANFQPRYRINAGASAVFLEEIIVENVYNYRKS